MHATYAEMAGFATSMVRSAGGLACRGGSAGARSTVGRAPGPQLAGKWGLTRLPPGDRKAVLKFVDALLVRQKVAGGAR